MEYSQHPSSEGGEQAEKFRRIIDPSWKAISPVKRMSASGRHLFSPIDSDQELNDLEVENAFVDGKTANTTFISRLFTCCIFVLGLMDLTNGISLCKSSVGI